MAEKDDGGFAEFINNLWAKIKEKVVAAISALGVAAAVAAFGTTLGGIIGAAIGFVLGIFIGWLISLFDNPDDIVGVRTGTLCLATMTKSYYDWASLTKPGGLTFSLDFHDDGHYQLNCGFRLLHP